MSENNAWTNEWLKAQQKFVESWSEMSKGWCTPESNSQVNMWANGLDMWRKTYPHPYQAQPETEQVISKCMDIGKGYFAMAEQIGKQITSGGKPDQVIHHWLEQLKTSLQQQAEHWSPMQHQASSDLMSQWMGPSASWQKMTASMLPFQMPSSGHTGWGVGEDFQQLNQLLAMPGLGFFREAQEKQQKGIKLAMDYQQANHKFNQSFLRVSIESLQLFQQKLGELNLSDEESAPSSLRGLYDLWVDVSEACYADYAMSEEYQALYGDMVNRLMQMKRHINESIDENMAQLNLPTRKEIDTVQQRLQETRRDNQALRRELREIRALVVTQNETAVSKPVVSKPVVKKPVVKRAAIKKTAIKKKSVKKTVSKTHSSKKAGA
ncbi:MAG: class III poly(R)-hydroxyalkanoic acid synthase subunit PhaE [Gammaproteobacteria bacterium]|nr:class III poly(R)-hydroxyalkanoic acid synthase subunit PhaE [Gammaproteobacteria bacterium]